jgi:8-oxo-dGTP pyrophosphatase MutT (NUDIX family)
MTEKSTKLIYLQSGVIPYIFENDELKILLITSMNKKNLVIPKGIIEEGLSARESALKEAYEEAGISGNIEGKKVGTYSYYKWGGRCEVKVYSCLVTKVFDEWPEKSDRKRAWYTPQNAVDHINNNDLKKLLKKFIAAKMA